MDKFQEELIRRFGEQRIKVNEPLSNTFPNFSTTATLFLIVNDKEELADAVTFCIKHNAPFSILDIEKDRLEKENFLGLVIKNDARKLDIVARKGKIQNRQTVTDFALVEAESGVLFSRLVRFTIEGGLGGVENGYGIQGSVGWLFEHEKEFVTSLVEYGVLTSVKVVSKNGEIQEVPFEKANNYLLVLSAVFKLIGEDKKILWLKAQKAAEKRGVREFSAL